MFCRNCGSQVNEGTKYCQNCGAPMQQEGGISQGTTGQESPVGQGTPQGAPQGMMPGQGMPQRPVMPQPKKKNKTLPIIGGVIGAVVVLGVSCAVIGGGSDTKDTSAKTETKKEVSSNEEVKSSESGRVSPYDLYSSVADNMTEGEDFYYQLNDKASTFLKEHSELFPTADSSKAAAQLDMSIDFAHIEKNANKYGDKLMALELVGVTQIFEEEVDVDYYVTSLNVTDVDGHQYFVIYNDELPDVFQDDELTIYGLPLGMSKFANTENGSTLCPVLAGSYIEKYGSSTPEANAETASIGSSDIPLVTEGNTSTLEYVIADSDKRYLDAAEVSWMTKEDLRLARNEIFARHGRMFDSADLQQYFNSKSWYQGTVPAAQFNESSLNEYEKKNLELIKSAENGKGSSSFETGWIYGTYVCHNNDIDAELDVGWYTSPEADYITLSGATKDGSGVGEFTGTVVTDADGVYVAADEYGNTVSFTYNESDTIIIQSCSDTFGGMSFPGFEGVYQKTKDLSHNVS